MILWDNKGVRIVNRDHVDVELTGVLASINSNLYEITYAPDGTAWHVQRQDADESYTVTPTSCTCPHTVHRKPETCKHRVAAKKLGLAKLLPLKSVELPDPFARADAADPFPRTGGGQ